jgi:hypothetical protein
MKRLLVPIAGLMFCGTWFLCAIPESSGQGKSAARSAGTPDIMRDIDDAIRLIEANDYETFLVRYAPVEILRSLRQKDLLARAAAVISEQPQTKTRLLIVLNGLKKQTPRFDKSGGLATIEFDPLAHNAPELQPDLKIPDISGLQLVGLESDPAKVIAEAIRLLETGDVATFADRLFPAPEVARLRDESQRQALVQQFKDNPEIAASMIADLKRMQSEKPEMTDGGKTALYALRPADNLPPRPVKLQKVGNDWRFFDDSPRVANELISQSKLKPSGAAIKIQLELVGGNWRFIEIPFFRPE